MLIEVITPDNKNIWIKCNNHKTPNELKNIIFNDIKYKYMNYDSSYFTFKYENSILTDKQLNDNILSDNCLLHLILKKPQYITVTEETFTNKKNTLSYKTLNNIVGKINCDINSLTVEDLKYGIMFQTNYPIHVQRIIYNLKELEDHKMLSDYDISDNAELFVVLRLRGGMYEEISGRNGAYEELGNIFYEIE